MAGEFARPHREGEWFEFGDVDAAAALSAATIELWDVGAIDGKKRAKRFPTPIRINDLWIAYVAPGGLSNSPTWDGSRQYVRGLTAGDAGVRRRR